MGLENNKIVATIVDQIPTKFPTMGGGRTSPWPNPVTEALKDRPLMFAHGVDVREVVIFVAAAFGKEYNRIVVNMIIESETRGVSFETVVNEAMSELMA